MKCLSNKSYEMLFESELYTKYQSQVSSDRIQHIAEEYQVCYIKHI